MMILASIGLLLLPMALCQPEIILSADGNSTVAGESFTFNCTTNSTSELTLYIDNSTDSVKAERVNSTDLGDNITEYTFYDTVPDDNGTFFACYVENFSSDELLLIVYYPPIFAAGNNTDIWIEQSEDTNFNLSCSVASANPPDYNMSYTNTSLYTDNVAIGMEEYVFVNGTIDNRGNYTCMAENDVNVSYINYWLFVGGDPNVTIETILITTAAELKIDVTIEDMSDAPATGVIIYVPDIISTNVTLNIEKPIIYSSRTYNDVIQEKIDTIEPGTYDVSMDVFNQLATVTQVYETSFIISSSATSTTSTTTSSTIVTSTTSTRPSPSTTPSPKKSNSGAVVAGVLVPLLLIIIVAVAIVAGVIIYRQIQRRRRKEYAFYQHTGESDNKDYASFKAPLIKDN